MDAARALIDRALARAPRRIDLLLARAYIQLAAGDKDGAATSCRDALSREPNSVAALNILGEALRGSDDGAAEAAWRRALEAAPRNAEALFHLGNLLAARGEHAQAVGLLERALKLAPGNPSLLINLGVEYDNLGDLAGAERCYRDVLATRPNQVEALANLAQLLFAQERFAAALPVYDRIVAAAPDAPAQIWNNRGVCQEHGRDNEGAVQSFKRALELEPDSPQILANLGFMEYQRRNYEQARPLLAEAHRLDPRRLQVAAYLFDLDMQFVDWSHFESKRNDLVTGVADMDSAKPGVVPPFAFMSMVDDPQLQLAAAKRLAWPPATKGDDNASSVFERLLAAPRVRLGFVSTVFHEHPVPRLLIDLLERLDHAGFEIYTYLLAPGNIDPVRARVERATTFRDVAGQSTSKIIEQIRNDDIGILFDIAGHTEHARPDIFAAQPAPIQINYLGQAGTLGASYFDFIPTDAFTTPAAEAVHFAEKLMYLNGCYFPSDPKRPIDEQSPRRGDYGLPDDAFVFLSQAAAFKLLPPMFDVWMRLLENTPGSVMWMRPMRALAKANLKAEARKRGIAEERIVFAPGEPLPRYLARFRLADLYLDTYPFGSHTTVNDSLYAGLPVVTLAGRSMAARASASQVHAAGLGELVADSLEGYEAIALALAQDRQRLRDIAERLRTLGRTSALFDMHAYAADFERALLDIWDDWRSRERARLAR